MQLTIIKLNRIKPPSMLLRPVMTQSVGYQEMLDSIRTHGLWQPLLVRPIDNDYELVDGNYRYTCCKQLRLKEVPCIVREIPDDIYVVAQLQANGIRPDTSPVEYAERLAYILRTNQGMNVPQLARLINKSPHWINKILVLRMCSRELNESIRRGEIPVESACALARLPGKLQHCYIESAKTMPVREFVKLARQELKDIREESRNAYIDSNRVNQRKPVPILRDIRDIRSEFKTPSAAGPVLLKTKAETPIDGWLACVAWVLSMDPDSLEIQRRQIKKRAKQTEEARQQRIKERRKLLEARKKAGDATLLIDGKPFIPITEFGEENDE